MKKKNILNLIKYYSENNDVGFKNEAYEIAKIFDSMGDYELSEYIVALLSEKTSFVPQVFEDDLSDYFWKVEQSSRILQLPEVVVDDLVGILNATNLNIGVNKFLFQGPPGTGKTESVKQLARILERDLYLVDFERVIDSKLGQTSKNISELFMEINQMSAPTKKIILLDELDALALDRNNSNDLREMGRATSTVLKGLDSLNQRVIVVATTNMFDLLDKALVRRFDFVIDFNRYSRNDLLEIAESILENLLVKIDGVGRNVRLFRKILNLLDPLPYPAELENLIKTSVAFSNTHEEFDYLRRLYFSVTQEKDRNLKTMRDQKFTLREIEILTNISKSQASREIRGLL